jgi:hypothetical protein
MRIHPDQKTSGWATTTRNDDLPAGGRPNKWPSRKRRRST